MNLTEFKQEFDKHFFMFVDKKISDYNTLTDEKAFGSLFDYLKTYIEGGKRLRPYAAYVAFAESEKNLTDKEWLVFIALELIHVLALIHDDIIDKATKRRGVDSVHVFVQKNFNIVRGDKKHFSNSQALLVGDLIFSSAFQALYSSGVSGDVSSTIHKMLDEVILGQMIDVDLACGDIAPRSKIVTKSKYKTALYTFARPFEVGCLLGNVPLSTQSKFFMIGELIGLTYQAQDDYLDVFDTRDILQKELMNDIKEGQQTLVTYHFFKKASQEQCSQFLKYFGRDFSNSNVQEILHLFAELDIQKDVKKELDQLFKDTKENLFHSDFSEKTKKSLVELITTLEKRS